MNSEKSEMTGVDIWYMKDMRDPFEEYLEAKKVFYDQYIYKDRSTSDEDDPYKNLMREMDKEILRVVGSQKDPSSEKVTMMDLIRYMEYTDEDDDMIKSSI